ncbi:MAG: MFS transporter, partial [Anaerolineae bacterium]
RTLDGITGGNITTAQAYISDVTTERQRAQGLGLLQAAFGAGFIFGPAFGGVLGNYGPVVPFIGAAIITTGTLLLTLFTLEESHAPEERTAARAGQPSENPLRLMTAHPALLNLLWIGFVASLAFSALPAVFALFADHVLFVNTAHPDRIQLYIGLMLTFNGAMQVVTQIALLKPLVTRLGERRLLLVGQVALILAMFGVALIDNAIVVTLLFAPFAFGRGVSEPSLQSLVTRFGEQRGQLLGLYQSARSLALIFGPIWAGYAFEAISPQAVFIMGGILVIMALLFALVLLRQEIPTPRHEAIQPPRAAD